MGLRLEDSNPCRGIGRYRRKGRERFLSDDEIRRLSAALSAHAERKPLQVAAIRLLSEQSHEAIPQELNYVAFVVVDSIEGPLEELIQEIMHGLRAELLGRAGRVR